MKRILLALLASTILLSTGVFGLSTFADNSDPSTEASNSYTTAERTDDDPFANGEGEISVEDKTPTFYYILAGVAGVIIVIAIAGFVTSKNKR